MKRMLVVMLVVTLFAGCAEEQYRQTAPAVIESAVTQTAKADAVKYLADVKERLAKDVKPEYFASEEWKAFVDAFWDGYNKGQESMKEPEFMSVDDITY